MNNLKALAPEAVAAKLKAGATLVDIREPDEFAREHVAGAINLPLSKLDEAHVAIEPQGEVVFMCRTGRRTDGACRRLAAKVDGPAYTLAGGIDAWRAAGLKVKTDATARSS
jgi:rhodanese-related sulfurtransferase